MNCTIKYLYIKTLPATFLNLSRLNIAALTNVALTKTIKSHKIAQKLTQLQIMVALDLAIGYFAFGTLGWSASNGNLDKLK